MTGFMSSTGASLRRPTVYRDLMARGRAHIDAAFAGASSTAPAAQEAIRSAGVFWSACKRTLATLDSEVDAIPNRVTDTLVGAVNYTAAARAAAIQQTIGAAKTVLLGYADTARQQLRQTIDRLTAAALPPKPTDGFAVAQAQSRVEMVLHPVHADAVALAERAAELLKTAIDENEAALAWVVGGSSWFRDYLRARLGDASYAKSQDAVTAIVSTALDTSGDLRAVRQLHHKIVAKDGSVTIEVTLAMLPDICDDLADAAQREAPRDLTNPPQPILRRSDITPSDPRALGRNLTGGF